MIKISVSEETLLTTDMELLRREGNPPQTPKSNSADDFEARSIHVCYRIEGVLAAMARMTAGPNAVFEAWTAGAAEVPTGPHVVDLNRYVVARRFRMLGLFHVIMLDTLLRASAKGFTAAVGATKPGRRVGTAMLETAFEAIGPEVMVTDPVNGRFPIQMYAVRSIRQHDQWWRKMLAHHCRRLEAAGYRFANSWPARTEERT
jgi:hypothetical protein